jgi:hypothetical protein
MSRNVKIVLRRVVVARARPSNDLTVSCQLQQLSPALSGLLPNCSLQLPLHGSCRALETRQFATTKTKAARPFSFHSESQFFEKVEATFQFFNSKSLCTDDEDEDSVNPDIPSFAVSAGLDELFLEIYHQGKCKGEWEILAQKSCLRLLLRSEVSKPKQFAFDGTHWICTDEGISLERVLFREIRRVCPALTEERWFDGL